MTNEEILEAKTPEEICRDICAIFDVTLEEVKERHPFKKKLCSNVRGLCMHILKVRKGYSINKTGALFGVTGRSADRARSRMAWSIDHNLDCMRMYNLVKVKLEYLNLWQEL